MSDELKPLIFSIADLAYVDEIRVTKNFQNPHDHAVYKATEVDAVIAKLKAENVRLKKKMDDYHLTSDIRRAKIKELKRALWLARALALSRINVDQYIRTHMMSKYWKDGNEIFNLACKTMQSKINQAKKILLKKAMEYK